MINLLPTSEKKEITAGRTNILLRKYVFVSLLLLGLLVSITATFYIIMMQTKSDIQSQVDANNAKIAKYQSTQKEIDDFKNNLALAKNILGKEIHYSKIIPKIASTLPPNTVLQSLELNNETISAPMELKVRAKTRADVVPLKTRLENSDVFQNVYFESVVYDSAQGGMGTYPVDITINVTLKPEIIKL